MSFLLKSIESVINQSYSNFEIILIDDGTTDDLTPLKKIINEDSRIRYFRQNHQGVSAARNLGIQEANGDYIAFLDSDDLFLKDKLKIQLDYMHRNGYEFCHTSYQKITIDEQPLEIINSGIFSGYVFPRILSSCGIATPTVMVKKSLLKGHKFIEEYTTGEDTCFWIDLAFRFPLGGLEQPLSLVRVNNTSAAYNLDKHRLGLLNIAAHIIRNPLYLPFESDIYFLLDSLISLFNKSTEMSAAVEKAQNIPYIICNLRKRRGRLRRLFISFGYDGFFFTLRKIVHKVKLRLLGQ